MAKSKLHKKKKWKMCLWWSVKNIKGSAGWNVQQINTATNYLYLSGGSMVWLHRQGAALVPLLRFEMLNHTSGNRGEHLFWICSSLCSIPTLTLSPCDSGSIPQTLLPPRAPHFSLHTAFPWRTGVDFLVMAWPGQGHGDVSGNASACWNIERGGFGGNDVPRLPHLWSSLPARFISTGLGHIWIIRLIHRLKQAYYIIIQY